MFHYIGDYVKQYNIEFLNVYDFMDDIGLSWDKDFADTVHLNYQASRRLTKYIGKYLQTNYEIPDHRGEEAYKSWDENWNVYKQRKGI